MKSPIRSHLEALASWYWVYKDIRRSAKAWNEIGRIAKAQNLKSIESLKTAALKTSDTLVILGSGPSINQLTESNLGYISTHDSLGFNFWLLHDFVPTYYLLETSPNQERNEVLFELLERKIEAYINVPLIVQYRLWKRYQRDFASIPAKLRSNLYLHAPWAVLSPFPKVVSRVLRYWERRLARPDWCLRHLLHHRASLSLGISFGVACGYKKLVLVGVDLSGSDYFWEAPGSHLASLPFPPNVQTGGIHATADSDLNDRLKTLPVTDYLKLLKDLVLDPHGIELGVANPDSLLCQQGFQFVTLGSV